MARYSMKNDWVITSNEPLIDYDGNEIAEVITAVGGLIDNQDKTTYEHGAIKVKVKGKGVSKTKTFKGETAWHQAERYKEDVKWEIIRAA